MTDLLIFIPPMLATFLLGVLAGNYAAQYDLAEASRLTGENDALRATVERYKDALVEIAYRDNSDYVNVAHYALWHELEDGWKGLTEQ